MTAILIDALLLLAFAVFCIGIGFVLGHSQNRYSRSQAGKHQPPRALTIQERIAALEPQIHALRTHEKG